MPKSNKQTGGHEGDATTKQLEASAAGFWTETCKH